MVTDSQTKKLFLILLGFTLFLTSVSAAQLSLEDDAVWMNDEETIEANITGNDVGRLDIANKSGDSDPETLLDKNGTVDSRDILDAVGERKGNYVLKLYNNNSEDPVDTRDIFVKELQFSIDNNGTGYVNKKLGQMPYTEPLKLTLGVNAYNNEEIDKEDINRDNFQITSREAEFTDPTDVNSVQTGTNGKKVEVTLSPLVVEAHPQDEKLNLKFTYSHQGSSVSVERRFNPKIFERRGEPVTSPSSQLYANEISKYDYTVNVFENGEDTNPSLWEEDYDLKVVELDNGEVVDEILEDEKWLSVQQVEEGDGDQRLTLNAIPQLETGTYRLITRLKQPDTDEYSIVDSIRVRNGLKLSGRVVDSQNRGVRTEMNLDREGTVIPINTAGDGTYYKEIDASGSDSSYGVKMNFFDRGMSSSDAEVSVREVDFAEKNGENLAGDSESIKFQYWDNPPVEQKAIKPINMMAVKFAYPLADDGHRVRMKFDPTDVNTDNLKVYECSQWNFEGRSCLGDWEVVDDFSINYQGWRANFHIDNPYRAEDTDNGDQNILMNAYIVGTSADLVLNGGLSISGPEDGTVATGSQIEVRGNINSENENAVEGADVEVSFHQGDTEISSLDTVQTDVTGGFSSTGKAPEEPGNYSVKVTADKENYNMMEKKFDNRFETVIEEGIAVRTGSTIQLSPGEDTTAEITVQNTGQTTMEDVSLSFEGMDSQYYSVSDVSFDEVLAGEEATSELTVSLPSDYCDGGCGDWPSLDVSAMATNPDGEEFEAETETLQVQISRTVGSQNGSEQTDSEQSVSETEQTNGSESRFTESVSDLENATGEFLASQSSLNMALGLIMVFMMVLAGAVKKQDEGGSRTTGSRGDRGGRGGRPRVQKPNVGGSNVEQVNPDKDSEKEETDEVDTVLEQIESDEHDVDSQIDAIAGSVVAEEQEDTKVIDVDDGDHQETVEQNTEEPTGSNEKFVCEETGEEFDTKAALKLHRQINGLDN
jgi:hypothetical protein